MQDEAGHVLVADDEPNTIRWAEMNLKMAGFDVSTASEGPSALEKTIAARPDLVLLDVVMPRMDGFEVCRRLRRDPRTKYTSVIFLTASDNQSDLIKGLDAGADDFLVKPVDPDELIARIRRMIRRSRQMRGVNPLTQLPGNSDILEELKLHVASPDPFALLYIDLDNFKSFNDYYGFARGDVAIKTLADVLRQTVQPMSETSAFLGHIGGDDFAALVPAESAESVAQATIDGWEERVEELYGARERQQGYVEVVDRRGDLRRFPLVSVSIGIASNLRREIKSHWEAAEIAREMKERAKTKDGSCVSVDRRETPVTITL
jgi:diguanylate cyclase (GGDEF)-like protein